MQRQGEKTDFDRMIAELQEQIIEQERAIYTDGCGPTVACGSKLTTMVYGMSLEGVSRIRPEDLLDALGGLPEESVHCAELAVNTLREAISNRLRIEGQ